MAGPKLNETRPAFPLPSNSPAGIVVSAMTSLYGAKLTSTVLSDLKNPPKAFRDEAK